MIFMTFMTFMIFMTFKNILCVKHLKIASNKIIQNFIIFEIYENKVYIQNNISKMRFSELACILTRKIMKNDQFDHKFVL